ncbi:glycosyltransferase [Curtobacterium sp. 20TX0008]|uniref:glycosyltransferase n=1 Tax=Curtobacterium sp. 20TX0008 TaxID=3022018 RepID=UPI00232F5F6A|nr:glycosyltransferase [Curtobacterium sp. 20TX0008]MDB6427906.1 glycosyltransferase [Curtobacterium sp. 20TX0008]
MFYAMRGVHESRAEAFRAVGRFVDPTQQFTTDEPPILALHHGAWSRRMKSEVLELADWTQRTWAEPVELITNNIFAVCDDFIAKSFPRSRRTTAVLGDWAAAQYRGNMLFKPKPDELIVVPNPQDSDFFRPPSIAERRNARARLGLTTADKTVLRIGSPHDGKWSRQYVRLEGQLRREILLLVGAPTKLRSALSQKDKVRLLAPIDNDTAVRELYWAADVFAHDAARGESFGNVLLEALLCGLPVVYRGRPFRDNTPWEFIRLSNFNYRFISRAWRNEVLAKRRGRINDYDSCISQYSVTSLTRLLVDSKTMGRAPAQVPLLGRLAAFCLHNPVMAAVKQWRLDRL